MIHAQLSPTTRLQMLGARQAALTEVLEHFNQLISEARSAEVDPTGGVQQLETNWRQLHEWLAEAGRENQTELILLRHELAAATETKTAASQHGKKPSPPKTVLRFFGSLLRPPPS